MSLSRVEKTIGDVSIGGGGDSITSWVQATFLGAAALFYPLVYRPLRVWANDEKKKKKEKDKKKGNDNEK